MNKPYTKAKQIKLLMDCAHMFAAKRACNERSFMWWWGMVKLAHFRGFLYTGFDNDEIDVAAVAFRVNKVTAKTTVPEKESGNILYVLAIVSESQDLLKLRRLMNWYIRENKTIKTIAYRYRHTSNIHYINVRRKKHGRQQRRSTNRSSNSTFSTTSKRQS